jgi:hypothetical protein
VDSEGRQRWLKVCKVDMKRRWSSSVLYWHCQ